MQFASINMVLSLCFMFDICGSEVIGGCCGGCYDVRAPRSGHCHVIFLPRIFLTKRLQLLLASAMAGLCIVTLTSLVSSGWRPEILVHLHLSWEWYEVSCLA